jgi:aspartate carbamoyltransferase
MLIKNSFFGKSFTSIGQIESIASVLDLFTTADKMRSVIENHEIYEPLKGKTVAILFYQPSTRTFTSFHSAATRLGAYVIAIQEMGEYSSAVKGETLEDTIRTIEQTVAADLIVLRHPEDYSSEIASAIVPIPIVNAGSGKAEHPTQALLDLYTIYQKFGRIDNLHVAMVGDLKYGRTIKSLAKLLALAGSGNRLTLIAPKELAAPDEFLAELGSSVTITRKEELNGTLVEADVVYMTRVQREWFEKEGKLDRYEQLKHKFILTRHLAGLMPVDSIIMHPLPRVGEIMQEVDEDPRAYYFKQMRSGLYVRMALLARILKEEV